MPPEDNRSAPDGATLDVATDVMIVARTIRESIANGDAWTLSLGLVEQCLSELRRLHDRDELRRLASKMSEGPRS